MTSRKENETLNQNNGVELSDEALAAIMGGCDEFDDWSQWFDGRRGRYHDDDYGRDFRCHGLLRVVGDLIC
jgi:hypothetical protein